MKLETLLQEIKRRITALVQPIVRFFVRLELNPNWLTTISLLICIFAGLQFGFGSMRRGGLLLLIGGFFDMIDGEVARASDRVTRFGALYDSTLDRYAELVVFFGIGAYFFGRHAQGLKFGLLITMAVFIALAGSMMVSYVRARAEGLGFECKIGLMQRPERIFLVGVSALVAEIMLIFTIFIIAILANYTAIQRICHIYMADNSAKWKKLPADIDHE